MRAFSIIQRAQPMAKATAAVNASRWLGVKVNGDKAQVEIAPLPGYKTDGPASCWVDTTVKYMLATLRILYPFVILTPSLLDEQKKEVTEALYEIIREIARSPLSQRILQRMAKPSSTMPQAP